MIKPEILSPAGDFEKLKVAVHFGADAVYLGGRSFNLRAGAGNFAPDEMREAISYAHARNVKVYVTANSFLFERDLPGMKDYLHEAAEAGADAFIVSDPGVFCLAKDVAPGVTVHISTQANTTNAESARFWYRLGAKRIILARECSLADIKHIRQSLPAEIELEAFVHGAMCMAYSGRCLLSGYMLNRNANQGDCAQPCRYKYHVMEATRPGLYMPVAEDEGGTAIFSASDMCMAEHLPELVDAGLASLKIEGRMKTAFYVGLTTGVYRRALDTLFENPALYEKRKAFYKTELEKCAHRDVNGFSTGFYFGDPIPPGEATLKQARTFVGIVRGYDAETGVAEIEQRNKFSVGDEIEVYRGTPGTPKGEKKLSIGEAASFLQTVKDMRNGEGEQIESAPHPQQVVKLKMAKPVKIFDLICK
jgi:putative protease